MMHKIRQRSLARWAMIVSALAVAVTCWPVQSSIAQDAGPPSDTARAATDGDAPTAGAEVGDVLAKPDGKSDTLGVIITIHDDMIGGTTVQAIQRRIKSALDRGADAIIFEINTPGGEVISALNITTEIRRLRGKVKTVAWVNTDAYSAGSMIAVSCEEIVTTPAARVGDSQIISMGGEIPESYLPKVETPVVTDFLESATLNGYSQVLSEAFVRPALEVWWLENTKTGERKFVFRDEKMRLLNEHVVRSGNRDKGDDAADADVQETIVRDESKPTDWVVIDTYYDTLINKDVALRQPVVPDNELLLMNASKAIAFGFSKGIVADETELQQRYHIGRLEREATLWSENLVSWLTFPTVRGLLMIVFFLGLYVEMNTPGVGIPGLIALAAITVVVGAPFLTGLANVWEILLIGLGFVLLGLEFFVIPGFGIAGISGLALLFIGLVATFVPEDPSKSLPLFIPSSETAIQGMTLGLKTVVVSMLLSLVGMFGLSKLLPNTPLFRKIIAANPTPTDVQIEDPYRGAARPGDIGLAETPLHPAGKGRFGSLLVDVVTQGELVDARQSIEVIERRGNRVVVRAVQA